MSVPGILEGIQKNDFSYIYFRDGKLQWSCYSYSLNQVLCNVTFLSWAVRKSTLDTIKRLIIYGCQVNQRESEGTTPLLIAVHLNRLDVVKLLLDNGASIDLNDSYGTPLAVAVKEGHVDIIECLLERGANAETCDIQGLSPFFRTILESKVSALELFLRKGCSNQVDNSKNTPLVAAIRYKSSAETIKCLLKHKVNINESQNEKTPLAWAAAEGNLEAVKILLNEGADADVISEDGETALISAIKLKQQEVVEYLLESHVNSCRADKNGKTPLFWATYNKDTKTIKLLLSHGAEYIIDSVFLDAIETQSLEIVQLLQENGASVNSKNDNTTPLMKCLEIANAEIAKYLIENGAKVLEDLETSKMLECMERKKFDVIKMLVENGAKINQADDSGRTLLTKAIEMENLEMVTYLLSRGADINGKTEATPLLAAFTTRNVEIVKYLTDNGANLQLETLEKDDQMTLLTKAVEIDSFDLVQYFVSRGADVNEADGSGLTPLVIAQSKNNFKILQYLVDSGAAMSEEEQAKNAKLAGCYRIAKRKSAEVSEERMENKRPRVVSSLVGSSQEEAKEEN